MSISAVSTSSVDSLSSVGSVGSTKSCAKSNATDDADSGSSSVKLSGPAQFIKKLKELEASDPAKAKKVLTDLANKLKAESQTDSPNGKRAGELADKLQAAADTGDLSSLTPPARQSHEHGHGPPPAGGGGHHSKATTAYQKSRGDDLMTMLDAA